MMEISYHITNALDPAQRRIHDMALVAHYRDELLRFDIDVPSLDALMHQFAIFLPLVFVTFMINESKYQTEAFNTVHASRYSIAMLDHNTKTLINDTRPMQQSCMR